MASEEKKNVESILKPALKSHGFRKKGGTWWRQLDNFIQIINIQGSQWSKRFYLNLGVYIKELGDKEWPAEYDCHVRVRLSSITESTLVNDLLNYEEDLEGKKREEISEIVVKEGIPWLDRCSSIEGARAEYSLPNRVMTKWQREQLDEYFA
jgi:hypothetical protein